MLANYANLPDSVITRAFDHSHALMNQVMLNEKPGELLLSGLREALMKKTVKKGDNCFKICKVVKFSKIVKNIVYMMGMNIFYWIYAANI